jgi:hypothetical protein
MPRRIATYTASDWLRLRPLSQGYKSWLWDRVDRRYNRQPPPDAEALRKLLATLAGRNVVASIAFNTPWTIRWQLRFVGRNLENAAFLVADNSTRPEARTAIAALCAEHGAAYLALPPNPYSDNRHASRSHGLALNWVYRNIIRATGPAAWGIFDHDLFPTGPFDPLQRLRGQPFYGDLVERAGGRYLWPGYCFFSAEADREQVLDFRQDWFMGLDTGGMNAGLLGAWPGFEKMAFSRSRSIGPGRNFAVTVDDIDWFDDCVHLGNASGWYKSNTEREPALDGLLERIFQGELKSPMVD